MLSVSTLLAANTFLVEYFANCAYSESVAYHHGNLRQALIDLAMHTLEKEGLESLSLRALAEELGVSKAAPYRHFATKRDLIIAMAAEGYELFANRMEAEEPLLESMPNQQRKRRLYQIYGEFALESPERYRLMFSRLGNSLHSERCRVNASRAFAVLQRQAAALYSDREDIRPAVLSLFAGMHGWVMIIMDDLIPPDTGVGMENWLDFALSPCP
jgi:AcrR family transcriptional regulator